MLAQTPPTESLAQYGLAGAVLAILLWFGWLVYRRERERGDRLEALLLDKILPNISESTQVMRSTIELLHDIRGDLRR